MDNRVFCGLTEQLIQLTSSRTVASCIVNMHEIHIFKLIKGKFNTFEKYGSKVSAESMKRKRSSQSTIADDAWKLFKDKLLDKIKDTVLSIGNYKKKKGIKKE